MVAWSSIVFRSATKLNSSVNRIFVSKYALTNPNINYVSVRNSGGHDNTLHIRTSRYYWKKFLDMAYFYLTIGILPMLGIITYCNIFIGESELAEIPEGYEPKNYEYYSHPITRFMAKFLPGEQQVHEINCHRLFEEQEKFLITQMQNKIRQKIEERGDYQAWYFKKPLVKYARKQNEIIEELEWKHMGHGVNTVAEDR